MSLVSVDSTTVRAHHDAAGLRVNKHLMEASERRTRRTAAAPTCAKRGIKAVIPEKRDQAANRKKKGTRGGHPASHDADLYKERNTVERLINKLKAWRGIATRCDKTPDSYLAGLHLRAAMIWIDDLIRTTK